MKANEAPKKVYMSPAGVLYKGDKQQNNDIEYTCTDTFIEKAVEFLKGWDAYRVCLEGHKDWFIEQFKKYMEE